MERELSYFADRIQRLRAEVGRVLVGQQDVVDGVIACLVADGHVLLEGVPGLGKTLLVRTLAQCLHLEFRRIQFTPDLMPADIIGTHLLEESENGRALVFRQGPVFTQILLADEINRATPKTQSAMLEAMQERQVTVSGKRRMLPQPFFVLATQNPLEQEGTYPLPEAQLDRFFFKINVPFPTLEELVEIIDRTTGNHSIEASAVLTPEELIELRRIVREVPVAPEIVRYAMRLVLGTHADGPHSTPTARQYVRYGASPRGGQTLILAGRVYALMDGRLHASLKDIRKAAMPALRHRIGLNFDAEADGLTADDLVERMLDEVPEVEPRIARELQN